NLLCVAITSFMVKFHIDPSTIGRLDFVPDANFLDVTSATLALRLGQLFTSNLEIVESRNGSVTSLFSAINWVECKVWDGRNSIICAVERTHGAICIVSILVGPNAPVVLEPIRGRFISQFECPAHEPDFSDFYLKALDAAYTSYKFNFSKYMSHPPESKQSGWNPDVTLSYSDFDFILYDREVLSKTAHARLVFNDYLTCPWRKEFEHIPTSLRDLSLDVPFSSHSAEEIFLRFSEQDHRNRVAPFALKNLDTKAGGTTFPFVALIALLQNVPGYELFEKRIAMFACFP
ncbi:hypothetical protein C8R45DRAFT_814414, partial [Mycena sanguinolenta]